MVDVDDGETSTPTPPSILDLRLISLVQKDFASIEMIRHTSESEEGSHYFITSKIGLPTQPLEYHPSRKRNIVRGGSTVIPSFNDCQTTPYAAMINEEPMVQNAYTNRYEWNEDPIRSHAPSVKL